MSEDGQASDYYRYYNMYKDLGNGTYIAAKMNYDGTFQVDTEMSTRYYSAYGVEDRSFYGNRFKNPWHGYSF
jgi:hypothetical protein